MISGPNKKEIVDYYGPDAIAKLEKILIELWMIAREKQ
jgi:hypothetical protein